jgi:hypothetical protein
MRLALERGIAQEGRDKAGLAGLMDWDLARVLLEVACCGSFSSAAERLNPSLNVVRRRIDGFERRIGAALFTRDAGSANDWALANDAEIGAFPAYACAIGWKIIPLKIELRRPFNIWLSYHPGNGRMRRVRHMINPLVEAFNSAKFPWLYGRIGPSRRI